MKVLLWLLTLFTLAVGISLAAHYNQGYVLLVMPPYRAEISLNLALVLVVGSFFVLYGFTRGVALMLANLAPLYGGYPAVYGLVGAFTFLLWVRLGMEHTNRLRAFTLMHSAGALTAVPLTDTWATRRIELVARDFSTLPRSARLLVDHLTAMTPQGATA